MKRSTRRFMLRAMLPLAFLLLLLQPFATQAFADEEEEDEDDDAGIVHDLTIRQYEAITKGSDVWMVTYTKEDCHACQQIKSILDVFAKDIHPHGVKIGMFDIEQTDGLTIAKAAGLNRLPTLRFFTTPPAKNPYTGKMNRIAVDFPFVDNQGLDGKMLRAFLKKELVNKVARVTADEWAKTLEEAEAQGKNVALTLTDRETTPALLKTLALKFGEDVVFVEVPPTEGDFLLAFGVETKELAKLFVLDVVKKGAKAFMLESLDAEAVVSGEYLGDLREPGKLTAFVEKFIDVEARLAKAEEGGGEGKKGGDKKKKDGSGGGGGAKPGEGLPVEAKVLNETNFKEMVLRSNDGWLVWFQQKGETTDAEWEKFMNKAEGGLLCGTIDCGDVMNEHLCQKEAGGKYRFKAYPYGEDKEDDSKGFMQIADAYMEAADTVPDTLRRVGDAMNQMLVEQEINAAFNSGRFPVIVLTKKAEPALLFKALALKLEPVFVFVLVTNPPAEVVQRFNGANVPSVNVLLPQDMSLYKDSTNIPVQHMLRIETYLPGFFGPMKFMSVINFFLQVLQRVDLNRAQQIVNLITHTQDGTDTNAQSNGNDTHTHTGSTGGPITHITDPASWESVCKSGSSVLCVIGLFAGADDTQKQSLLQEVADKEAESQSPWSSFSWVDATCMREFALAFDISEAALPTVVVYAPKKQRFAHFRGTMRVETVREFLSGILSGRNPTAPVVREPVVGEGGVCDGGFGGLDGGLVEEEEDIGDLMAEILAEEKKKKEEVAAAVKVEVEEARRKAEEEAVGGEGKKKVVRRKKKKGSDEL